LNLIKSGLGDSIVFNAEPRTGVLHAAEDLCKSHISGRQLVVQCVLMMFTQLAVAEGLGHELLYWHKVRLVTTQVGRHRVAVTKPETSGQSDLTRGHIATGDGS